MHPGTQKRAGRRHFVELFRKIIVTSAKGGIGKSTAALGLAAALSDAGHRTLLVDCDLGNRCLDLMLGLQDSVLYDLGDVAAGRCEPGTAFLSPSGTPNLLFCAAPVTAPYPPDPAAFTDALRRLAEASHAEFVICDTAGTGDTVRAIAADFADGALVIATQQPASIRAAERTASLMREWGALPCRLVISMFEDGAAKDGIRAGLLEIIDKTHVRTLGVIPKDRSLLLAQEEGKLPSPRTKAARAFKNIAARLTGEEIPLFSGIREIKTARVL